MTTSDVVDDLIREFSVDDAWVGLEEDWRQGRISARDCLTGQLKNVRVSHRDLERFLSTVKLDAGIFDLLSHLEQKGVKPVILSDNFVPLVKSILDGHGITGIGIYANDLLMMNNRLVPSFPYYNPECPSCAHCKKVHLIDKAFEGPALYIGDGRSDFCPAGASDMVFAKDSLAEYLTQRRQEFIRYGNLKDVVDYLRNWMYFV